MVRSCGTVPESSNIHHPTAPPLPTPARFACILMIYISCCCHEWKVVQQLYLYLYLYLYKVAIIKSGWVIDPLYIVGGVEQYDTIYAPTKTRWLKVDVVVLLCNYYNYTSYYS